MWQARQGPTAIGATPNSQHAGALQQCKLHKSKAHGHHMGAAPPSGSKLEAPCCVTPPETWPKPCSVDMTSRLTALQLGVACLLDMRMHRLEKTQATGLDGFDVLVLFLVGVRVS